MDLYPLKFRPILKPKVWGGTRLAAIGRGDVTESDGPIGESWELVDLPDACSVVANGPLAGHPLHDVIAATGSDLLGNLPLTAEGGFPLLVKFLDIEQMLSVQVHPDATYCASHPDARLKSEAWFIIDSDENARLYRGLRDGVDADTFREHIENNTCVDDLRELRVKPNACYYLPAGTCHAAGGGMLVAEIQTPSDTTFRVYDWGRTDRTLHLDEAMECMSLGAADVGECERRTHVAGFFTTVSRLLRCDHFQIEKVRMSEAYEQEIPYDRPAVWIVLEGKGAITNTPAGVDVPFGAYDVMLIPAGMHESRVSLDADTVWLDVQFPRLIPDEELMA